MVLWEQVRALGGGLRRQEADLASGGWGVKGSWWVCLQGLTSAPEAPFPVYFCWGTATLGCARERLWLS